MRNMVASRSVSLWHLAALSPFWRPWDKFEMIMSSLEPAEAAISDCWEGVGLLRNTKGVYFVWCSNPR